MNTVVRTSIQRSRKIVVNTFKLIIIGERNVKDEVIKHGMKGCTAHGLVDATYLIVDISNNLADAFQICLDFRIIFRFISFCRAIGGTSDIFCVTHLASSSIITTGRDRIENRTLL